MNFKTRKLIKSEDLNAHGTLFGGRLLQWLDEEGAIFAICQLGTPMLVTKYISEINFVSPAHLGDIIEIGSDVVSIGHTSITIKCEVRCKTTQRTICTIDKIVFVCVDENGKSTPHGKFLI